MKTVKLKKKVINAAIEELWLDDEPKKKTAAKKDSNVPKIEISPEVEAQCKVTRSYKRRAIQHCFRGATKNSILNEIRSRIHQKNWNAVKNLLLLLLPRNSADIELLIWRYCFILALYGGNSNNVSNNMSNVSKFFELCIGSKESDTLAILKNMLLLQ